MSGERCRGAEDRVGGGGLAMAQKVKNLNPH